MSEQKSPILADAAPLPGASHQTERPSAVKRILGGSVGRNLGLVIALVVLFIIGTITAGERFANIDNVLTILRLASIIGVISIGMTFVITAAGIDLSVGSVMGLATVVASLTAVQLAATQTSWILMVVVALAVGAVAGLVNGVVIAYGNVVAFMATLAMLVGARGLAELISGRRTQIVTNTGFLEFTRGSLLGVPLLIWIFVIVAIAAWILLNRTTFGRRTVAIGGNAEASRLAGIKVKRHLVMVYMLSGLTAGIAAIMMLGRTTAGTSTHGTLYELDAIAAVVVGGTLLIGGRGTIVGTILGVLIFSTLTNIFTQNNLDTSVQAIAKGLIIVIAVLLQQRFATRDTR
ncbi:ABC transporter permease [Mycetocola miduiensis]|uniref:Monosaccharide ABC transporter membrane protein, CUT2 family n=1 Tax=Mycetocola miduiensis TaxID=995034 RepID=A0A1I5C2Q7_9MICO|nr:monosaccharide ABC transporter membrane protein, CUT2 family [Mycetocola miduiensis]